MVLIYQTCPRLHVICVWNRYKLYNDITILNNTGLYESVSMTIFTFCSHCVLAVQPTLQPGQDIPHVAAPTDQTGVPPGEGCYQCDIEDKDIPLSKRAKRSAQVN